MQPRTVQQYAPSAAAPTVYEDNYSDALSTYDQSHQGEPQTGSIERDNKLLSFGMPIQSFTLLDLSLRAAPISINAQLHGMFFLTESLQFNGDSSTPTMELTCYRRNLFQITGNITLPRGLRYLMTEHNEQLIVGQELMISARETVEGNVVKIICVPWKSPSANTTPPAPEDKSEKEPASIPVDLTLGQDEFASHSPDEFVSIPIAWKRLQFRVATANNGRRKELQQHFIVSLKLVVTLSNGTKVPVSEVQSGAIIVRGRSPRNFQSRKDMPISGALGRRSHLVNRNASAETSPRLGRVEKPAASIDLSAVSLAFDAPDVTPPTADFFDFRMSPAGQTGPLTTVPQKHALSPTSHGYARTSPDLHRPRPAHAAPRAPVCLSLMEDEARSTSGRSSESPSRKRVKMSSPSHGAAAGNPQAHKRQPSFTLKALDAGDDSADMLYEYFPLGLDDWMPPVDAVYRPHVVHHTNLPADPKALKNRSKRYFSEDQP
jgi:hypothetical protein